MTNLDTALGLSKCIILPDVEQGSEQWHRIRLGIATASRFGDVMTNGRGSDSMGKTAYTYMYDLIGESLTQKPADNISGLKSLEWGNANEAAARATYQMKYRCRIQQVGFAKRSDMPHIGASPDAFVVDPDEPTEGGAEIKCPMCSRIHLQYLEAGVLPADYRWQVQGLMFVTGRTWWDFVSYDPRMPPDLRMFRLRVRADQQDQEDLENRLRRFNEQMIIKLSKFRQIGQDAPSIGESKSA